MTLDRCPVCLNTHSQPAQVTESDLTYYVDCSACGRFSVSRLVWDNFLDPDSSAGRKLSSICRARLAHRIRTGGSTTPEYRQNLSSDFVKRFVSDDCPGPTPAEQATNLITYIGDEIARTGERIESLPAEIYSIIGAPNPTFAGDLAIELTNRGLIDGSEDVSANFPPNISYATLTLDGWEHYEAEKRGKIAGKYGFIAMKFGDPALDPYVEDVVKPAVKVGIGYDLVDMRDVARAGIIDNIMRAQIRDSAFVIVDLTHDNSGAYWEAGYAEGLGKPVIYICEQQKFDKVKTHFDTNHCTTVIWSAENADDFSRELVATLRRSLNLFPESK